MNIRLICTHCGRFEDVAAPVRTFNSETIVLHRVCVACIKGH